MKNRSILLKLINSVLFALLLIAFVTCNKGRTEPQDSQTQADYSSVTIVKGNYKIDSSIAMSNGAKEKLLFKLETEKLIDIKTVAEIPDFLKEFIASVSANKKFDIANSGEEWQEGGWINFDIHKKVINTTSAIAKPCPSKQLVYCGVGKNMALISYFTGGVRMAQNMLIIKFENKKIVDLWFDNYWTEYNSDFEITKKDNLIQYIKKVRNNNC